MAVAVIEQSQLQHFAGSLVAAKRPVVRLCTNCLMRPSRDILLPAAAVAAAAVAAAVVAAAVAAAVQVKAVAAIQEMKAMLQ
jgi:hypothetical protein